MSSAASPLILMEFNELTPALMERFMAEGLLPNFKRLYGESQVYVTDAEEPPGGDLDPWIQWVTLHTGVAANEHGVLRLSDPRDPAIPVVWDLLSRQGFDVWLCGSMNAEYEDDLSGFVLPDPWSTHVAPYPKGEFEPFFDFIRANVQDHYNPDAQSSRAAAVKFISFLARRGLTVGTATAITRQLISERRANYRWRRAAVLDKVQFDVFKWYYRKHRPALSTFFLNSTAHFQHSYWRNMEPELFAVQTSNDTGKNDAILFGYQQMDELVGHFMELAGDDATLMFCTALSQQPYVQAEQGGGKHNYVLKNREVLRERSVIADSYAYEPVMSGQFYLRFDEAGAAQRAAERLQSYVIDGAPVFSASETDPGVLFCSAAINKEVAPDAIMRSAAHDHELPFFDVLLHSEIVKSGWHHPDGMLWLRTPQRQHNVYDDKISLRSVAPMILDMFDVPKPDTMRVESFLLEPTLS